MDIIALKNEIERQLDNGEIVIINNDGIPKNVILSIVCARYMQEQEFTKSPINKYEVMKKPNNNGYVFITYLS